MMQTWHDEPSILLEHTAPVLAAAEMAARDGAGFDALLPILRQLSLDQFGALLVAMPTDVYPNISKALPAMAPEKIQRTWTGRAGMALYPQTSQFVRAIEAAYARHTGKSLIGARVLDFGCGYGRLIRMMYYFTDSANIFGVDPWANSLKECAAVKLPGNFAQSKEIPESLPIEAQFDFGFAFSVFTHLRDYGVRVCLAAIRKNFRMGGLFVGTLRPIEFWGFMRKRQPSRVKRD